MSMKEIEGERIRELEAEVERLRGDNMWAVRQGRCMSEHNVCHITQKVWMERRISELEAEVERLRGDNMKLTDAAMAREQEVERLQCKIRDLRTALADIRENARGVLGDD